jgi:hypothetical protein
MTPADLNQPDRPSRLSKVRRQDEALSALLQNSTMEKAAQAAGVHPTTLRRWWKDPDFRSKYDGAAKGYLEHAIGRMQSGSQVAVATVMHIMRKPEASDTVRLQAAKYVLDSGKRWDRGASSPNTLESRARVLERAPPEEPLAANKKQRDRGFAALTADELAQLIAITKKMGAAGSGAGRADAPPAAED